jgi:hypothetical protein
LYSERLLRHDLTTADKMVDMSIDGNFSNASIHCLCGCCLTQSHRTNQLCDPTMVGALSTSQWLCGFDPLCRWLMLIIAVSRVNGAVTRSVGPQPLILHVNSGPVGHLGPLHVNASHLQHHNSWAPRRTQHTHLWIIGCIPSQRRDFNYAVKKYCIDSLRSR